jgi:hypothetical protein
MVKYIGMNRLMFKAKLCAVNSRAASVARSLVLFVNVIQNFLKAVQICVPPYIRAGHGRELSKSVPPLQNCDV